MDQFTDKFTLSMYWTYLVVAIVSGALMAINTRMTHSIYRSGHLRHEALFTFYGSLLAVLVVPSFFAAEYMTHKKKAVPPDDTTNFLWIWALIIVCLVAKALVVERRLFNRFTLDFDAEL